MAVPARYTKEALEDLTDLGPAMRSLNPRQRGFVLAMFDLDGDPSYVDCARAAGYKTDSPGGLKVQAHALAHNEKVQAAIREEHDRRCTTMLPMAHKRLGQMVKDPFSKDHFGAVKHAQALAGASPKQIHVIEHITDRGALIQEIKGSLELLRSLGVKIGNELLPANVVATEAEYEIVESDEGLEDLL